MGEVTVLTQYRAARRREAHPRPPMSSGRGTRIGFYFDPCCPFSYLAAERVERWFSDVEWIPVPSDAVQHEESWSDPRVARLLRRLAERRAAELRLPLVWPEPFSAAGTAVLRVADCAAGIGKGSAFALAAARLAFCGGFDLGAEDNLLEAAAAAGIESEVCLGAARDESRDVALAARARGLLALGITQLPALEVGVRWFAGETSLAAASAWWHSPPVAASR